MIRGTELDQIFPESKKQLTLREKLSPYHERACVRPHVPKMWLQAFCS